MSLLDKMKNTSTGADSTQADARDSVYEAVHLDAPAGESSSAHSVLPDSQLSPAGDSTLASTVYSTMEPLPVKVGDRTLSWQKVYGGLAVAGLVGTLVMVVLNTWLASRSAEQVRAAGQALTQSQRLAKATSTAMVGNPVAFSELRESLDVLTGVTRNLASGDGPLARAPSTVRSRSSGAAITAEAAST